MGLFDKIFGKKIQGPKADEIESVEFLYPSDIKRALHEVTGLSHEDASAAYKALFCPSSGLISEAIKKNIDVKLLGFGKFTLRERSAGQVRLPKGRIIQVPARNYPAFVPSARLKKEVR